KIPGGELRRRVGEALELVRLTGYERRLPRQLSGGEQQRVALARALVFQPRVLLMDEPLGALDEKLRAHMQGELKRIQRHLHVTVIYVTHDQEEALTMSDRVAVMRGGRTEQVGTPAELYEAPVSPFVADFVGESNFIEGVVVAASGPGRTLVRTDGGLELWGIASQPLRAGQRVVAAVRPEKLEPTNTPAAGPNCCKGVIEDVVYAGDATRYSVGLGAFCVYPLLGILVRSVDKNGYTLESYRQVFRTGVYLTVIGLTFRTATIVTLICLLVGYPLAYVLATVRPRLARWLTIIVVL